MVLGVTMMATMLPTMIGLNEATQHTRDHEENRQSSARKQRCNLVATCSIDQGNAGQREQVHNAKIYVGQQGKVSLIHSCICTKLEGKREYSPLTSR